MKSPIQDAIHRVELMQRRKDTDLEDLKMFLELLLEQEKEEFKDAWVDGNRIGWNMESDWPDHGYVYYENRFKKL